MAMMITDDCINCGACENECPINAIYEGGSDVSIPGYNQEFFYVDFSTCTDCVGYHDEPQCQAVCPVDAIVE